MWGVENNMPRIFDNIEENLLPALKETLDVSERADFCVGYFNLRGWRNLADNLDPWPGGDENCCRLLVGMHITPSEELRDALRADPDQSELDNQTAIREKRRIASEFRDQLTIGVPTNSDEAALRRLAKQIRNRKIFIRVYLRHSLHAKLYMLHRRDPVNPIVAYLGSSNLTLAGLSKQGELNVDVLDSDATKKLASWFEDRWNDRWCLDISQELADIIDESWAGERLVPPYLVYLKMAYHLAREARAGLSEFRIPSVFGDTLFDFQVAAVKIAAHHLHKRGGVLLGDVVGLGKSMMATALAKIFEIDFNTETLIICPKNLVGMWEDYAHTYHLRAKVMSIGMVIKELPENTRRFRIVLIDESHNLRNKEGKRWRAIREYVSRNDSLCILLSATPYNKSYMDLSGQLGLFLPEDSDIGIRPENLISNLGGEHEFVRRHQCPVKSLSAFDKSDDPDDWRDLMRLYMVRRTRGFIMQHYSKEDDRGKYLEFSDGTKSYFPERVPKNLTFEIDDANQSDVYARFYSDEVVGAINALTLPRYGLGNYVAKKLNPQPTNSQLEVVDGLSRAGTRLMGFCRTNLFKRLESAGPAFLLSVERHIMRNHVVIHALKSGSDVPIGSQGAELLDSRFYDEDADDLIAADALGSDSEEDVVDDPAISASSSGGQRSAGEFHARAAEAYKAYSSTFRNRFKWLPASTFSNRLKKDLEADATALLEVLNRCGDWHAENDVKLLKLIDLVTKKHPAEKVLVFTQFADTARYLSEQLKVAGLDGVAEATGDSIDPTTLAWQFSPESNNKRQIVKADDEIRIMIATDVLSEGQNLQDCAIIVNYDLPWAIIRLIQRAGRVDRIGQKSKRILCYSFMPSDGIERLIRLRARVRQRLTENAEVVGSDETFFDDEEEESFIRDLYTEKNGILDDESDSDVDLASYAYQIWKNATDADPSLIPTVESMPDVVYATKKLEGQISTPKGVLVYMRNSQGTDALTWIDEAGNPVTQSQFSILRAAACRSDTEAIARTDDHHQLTQIGLEHIISEEKSFGGALGRPSGARFKTYERLKKYRDSIGDKRDLFVTDDLVRRIERSLEEIYRYPLFQTATDTLNRQLKAGINDNQLVDLILSLREDGRFCVVDEQDRRHEPRLICSMGLI